MATVYLAHDVHHDRPVALKVLHSELAATLGPERFLREVRTTARLQHPHILPVLDSGEAAGQLWYTMPYVRGESLRDRLRREVQLPVEVAVDLARQVALALDYAHREGVVHRDLKPENILLSEGQALVADFGVAKALAGGDGGQLTETGLAVGTPAYMSPEQASGGQVDARSDVYSLGCVLYEMLAGEPPFTGATPQALISKRLVDPVPSIRRIRQGVPDAVEQALTRALAKISADRFQSARELGEALAAAPRNTGTPAEQLPAATAAVPARSRRLLLLALAALVAAGTVGSLLWQRTRGRAAAEVDSQSAATPWSVAVLPFANMSSDQQNEYFSDGMTEGLISALGRVPGLRVTSRPSAFAFKGRHVPLGEVGATLRVTNVLTGSVQRSGDRLRISAQLVDVAADSTLWSGTFDRNPRDIFDVQDEVSRAIVRALQLTLRVEHQARLVRRATRDIEAYTFYLQSLSAPPHDAIEYLEAAIQRDPNFAPAYVELAANWSNLAQWGRVVPREGYAKARAAALRAISLDSTLSEAHGALGRVMADHDYNWKGAEAAYRRALALNPSDATARSNYAFLLSETGRVAEAVAQRRQAVLLLPLGDPTAGLSSAAVELYYARRYDEAIEDVLANFRGDSTNPWRNWMLGRAYEQKGMLKEAIASHEKAVAAARDNAISVGALGHAYGIAGRRTDALKIARELEARAADGYVPGPAIALVYTGLGDTDRALQWLERGFEQRDRWMVFLKVEPRFDPLRTDPRFADLLRRMRLE